MYLEDTEAGDDPQLDGRTQFLEAGSKIATVVVYR
jgi:hypothetical protein